MKKIVTFAMLFILVLTACSGAETEIDPVIEEAPAEEVAEEVPVEENVAEDVSAEEAPAEDVYPEEVPAGAIIDTDSYYRLQTKFLEGENKCLEGNRLAPESVLGGAAFQDDCQDVTGQFWKFVDAGNGYYRLQTMFLEEENKCLEGNRFAEESVLGGGAFMDDCQDVTGQLWNIVEAEEGYYRMQTMFLEGENKCLEGNRLAEESVLGGMAFMDDCQNVTGQLWKLVPVQ